MPKLNQQKHFRSCAKLPFCYICGKPFGHGENTSRDHVPPKSLFLPEHRDKVLVLPTHANCNTSQSIYDDAIGQLVRLLHRKRPRKSFIRDHLRLFPQGVRFPNQMAYDGYNLKAVVWRWVKGFHAALYKEALPSETRANVHLPMRPAKELHGQLIHEPILPQQRIIVAELKKNRVAGTLDRICACSGKCLYEAFWDMSNEHKWICLFGLRIYDWEILGDQSPPMGCVGVYMPPQGKPTDGTRGTTLSFPSIGGDLLDPFAF